MRRTAASLAAESAPDRVNESNPHIGRVSNETLPIVRITN